MAKWRAYATVSAGKFIGEFEAATKEDAEEQAWGSDEAYVSVCHQCSRQVDGAEIVDIVVERVD